MQGVGFRPFVHRLARGFGLSGFVSNTSNGVTIEVEGEEKAVSGFCEKIETAAPPGAQVRSLKIERLELRGFCGFEVRESIREAGNLIFMPPDLGTCSSCLAELFDPDDRRYLYPFINCTDCGPRFSIIGSLPYDRAETTMKYFDMCPECAGEYAEISDRRYHAQPNACFDCGPSLELLPGRAALDSGVVEPSGKQEPDFNKGDPPGRTATGSGGEKFNIAPPPDFGAGEESHRSVRDPGIEGLHGGKNPDPDFKDTTASAFPLNGNSALEFILDRLEKGGIIAIKGLGGFHIACDATNESAVETLKTRKKREQDKPLAVMAPSVAVVREFCEVSKAEEMLLAGQERPIVLLRKKKRNSPLAGNISPGNRYIGVMLPYTPLHHLLFRYPDRIAGLENLVCCAESEVGRTGENNPDPSSAFGRSSPVGDIASGNGSTTLGAASGESGAGSAVAPVGRNSRFRALVMTSGNTSDEPIVKDNDEAAAKLSSIADYILCHDRRIHRRIDDSVVRILNGKPSFVRRSRGFVPSPITLDLESAPILACGAELKNTFCLANKNMAFLSQHVGDMKNLETFEHFCESIERFEADFRITPEYVACDLHPDYLSTRFAREFASKRFDGDDGRLIAVQHHHAHIASCMAENGLNETVIGVAFDGAGLGADGEIWGGEFLVSGYGSFERAAHLEYVPLPGGDAAVREPWRMAVSYLLHAFDDGIENLGIPFTENLPGEKVEILARMIGSRINTKRTSSLGRLFDAVSALVLERNRVNYESQGAVELENIADESITSRYEYSTVERNGTLIIDTRPVIQGIVKDIGRGIRASVVSAKFHNTVIRFTAGVCRDLSARTLVRKVVLSGGCFQNRYLSGKLISLLEKSGLECYYHTRVPPNDGGIALGQAVSANERVEHVRRDSGKGC